MENIRRFYEIQRKARTLNYFAKVLISFENALKTVRPGYGMHQPAEAGYSAIVTGQEEILSEVKDLTQEILNLLDGNQAHLERQYFIRINFRFGIVRVPKTQNESNDRQDAIGRFEEVSNETWSNSNMDCMALEIQPSQYPQPGREDFEEFQNVIVLN